MLTKWLQALFTRHYVSGDSLTSGEATRIVQAQSPKALGVAQRAWINANIPGAAHGAKRVAKADANAAKAAKAAGVDAAARYMTARGNTSAT